MGETGFILAKTPEPQNGEEAKECLRNSRDILHKAFGDLFGRTTYDIALDYIERLEQAMFLKPLSWDEAVGDDAFLEIKGDEYIDAALNCLAFSQVDGNGKIGFVIYKTHEEDEFKLFESEYGKTWRCWARRPTDEERAAAVWEGE